mgnify:CR=1 FL=1
MNDTDLVQKLHIKKEVLFNEIAKVIIGQREIIDNIFIALLCRGHVLLQGVPGLGKTLIIKTISDTAML